MAKKTDKQTRCNEVLSAFFDNTNDAIFILDLNGHVLDVNRIACERLGYSRDELLTLTLADIDTPEALARVPTHMATLQQTGHLITETRNRRKDGSTIPVEISASLIEYGGHPAILALARDISLRHAAEHAVKLGQQSLQALLDASAESAILLRTDGVALAMNEIAAQRLGASREELLGKDVFDFMPADTAARRRKILAEVVLRKEPRQDEDIFGGIHTRAAIHPITDNSGEVIQLAIYVVDITAQQRGSGVEQMLHALDRLVLSGETQESLLNFLCHEMVRIFHLPLAWVGRKERDGNVSILAGAGQAVGYLASLQQIGTRWDMTPQGSGPVGNAIRSGFVKRMQITAPQFAPWRKAASAYNFRSVLAMPLLIRGEVFGVLAIYISSHDTLESETVREWLDAIADRLRLTLENMMDHAQLRLLGTALRAAGNGVMITDRDGRIQWVNDAFVQMSGYSSSELMGQTPRILKSGEHDADYYRLLWKTLRSGLRWSSDTIERARDGKHYTVRQTITPIFDEKGDISHFVSIHEDITAQKASEERIHHLARYDQLTQLPNRGTFNDRLSQCLAIAKRERHQLGLLFLDLNNFKAVNDTLGHSAGDLLLQQVAQRLKQSVRDSDTVARIGGDEFTIILPNIAGEHDCATVADKIIHALETPFVLNDQEVLAGASIGIALYPAHGNSSDDLLRSADSAMYRAKTSGNNQYRFTGAE